MPFAGKGSRVYTNGFDMSRFLKKITSTFNSDIHDTTIFGSTDKTFTPTLRHATLSAEGFYEAPSSFQSDAIFNSILNTTSIWSFYEHGTAVGALGVGMRTIETKYEVVSDVAAVATLTVDGQITETRDLITSLHNYNTIVANGASATTTFVDNGVNSVFGLVGYLQADTFTGGVTLNVVVQHSSGGAFSNLITFTASTNSNGQKIIQASTNVKKWLRTSWLVSGGPGSCQFNVGVRRKTTNQG